MSARSFNLDKKRQGNVTIDKTQVVGEGEQVKVILHQTAVVIKQPKGDVFLSSGGWRTNTTKTAINRALELLGRSERIVQRKGQWYLELGDGAAANYFDGMKLS